MPLTVLTDQDVRDTLDTLTKENVLTFHSELADALHSYSTASDPVESGCCSTNQPKRVALKQRDGSTTLFMPSMSDSALGVKVMTVSESKEQDSMYPDMPSLNMTGSPSPQTSSQESFSGPSRASTTSSTNSMNATSSSRTQSSASSITSTNTPSFTHPKLAEDVREPLGLLEPSATSPKGSVTLLEPNGQPRAIINASTLTAFRTALVSTALLKLRTNVHTLTVFGAGLQAYWHIYLTLILQGDSVHHLNLINRDFQRAQRLLMSLAQSRNQVVFDAFLREKLRPQILTPLHTEYARLLKEHVRNADVIYCCTPATSPLFPPDYLTNTNGRKKARYIVAIGSYKPHMQELHEDILRQAVRGPEETRHHGIHLHHRHAHEGGAIIVDTIEGALKESGEVIKAGIGGQGLVELGELVMLKKAHWQAKAEREAKERERREREESHSNKKKDGHHGGHGIGHLFHHGHGHDRQQEKAQKQEEADGGLKNWLERGNVIYKSVGLSVSPLFSPCFDVRLT